MSGGRGARRKPGKSDSADSGPGSRPAGLGAEECCRARIGPRARRSEPGGATAG